MNLFDNISLLVALPVGMVLAGYWLAARLTDATAAERIATATLIGLSLLLWNVAIINFYKPLSGIWSWICLWPVVPTFVIPNVRHLLLQDAMSMARSRNVRIAAAFATVFVAMLLWPLIADPTVVFYDGTSNHDSFFWISAAEHLKRNSYMQLPLTSPIHPLNNATPAIIGWHPIWGRMGSEGLLALVSAVVGASPIKVYLIATTTLVVPWLASTFLAVRTFWSTRLSTLAIFGMVALQSVFVYFHGNANLPNLVGALMGSAAVISTRRSLDIKQGRGTWLILLALTVHGLICSYPEMLPFAVLPSALLWLRSCCLIRERPLWSTRAATAFAWIGGIVINPASSIRGWIGFVSSFNTARANQNWGNLFEPLSYTEYFPALATLAVETSKMLGPVVGLLLSGALITGVVFAFRRATDRIGALFTISGSIALLAYTFYSGFNYGWQKTVQFGGAFWPALLPVAVIQALVELKPDNTRLRMVRKALLLSVVAFFGLATIMSCLEGYKWSRRKVITNDWFTVKEYAKKHLKDAAVMVDGATFRMSFFHGMWATYFLQDSALCFAGRGHENGGYVRDTVLNESRSAVPMPSAYLVSREWMETFDANSECVVKGDTVALIRDSNRILLLQGLQPENGIPETAQGVFSIVVRPHSGSQLSFKLSPRDSAQQTTRQWQVERTVVGAASYKSVVSGPPPWDFHVPLVQERDNRVQFVVDPAPVTNRTAPFVVTNISIKGTD